MDDFKIPNGRHNIRLMLRQKSIKHENFWYQNKTAVTFITVGTPFDKSTWKIFTYTVIKEIRAIPLKYLYGYIGLKFTGLGHKNPFWF